MPWPPARFVAEIVESSAPRPIDPEHHPIRTRGYLREFFEAVLRMRAGDERLKRQQGAAQLAALYDSMPIDAVIICLTDFNRSLKHDDDARFPPAPEKPDTWGPLAATSSYVTAATDLATYADLVATYSSSLDEVRAGREVVEAGIAVRCDDSRRSYLREEDRSLLLRLTACDAETLLTAYRTMNNAARRLSVDDRIPFDPITPE